MLRVTEKYVVDVSEQPVTDQILQMCNQAAAENWTDAHALYAGLKPSELERLDCFSHSVAAEICLQAGNIDKADLHADRAVDLAQTAGEAGLYALYKCWLVFKDLGDSVKTES